MKLRPALRPILLSLSVAAAVATIAGCKPGTSTDNAAQPAATAVSTQDAAAKAAQLNKIYADYWEAYLKLNPVLATFTGDTRYNGDLPDFGSQQYRDESKKFLEDWKAKVEAIGSAGLTDQDLLNYEIFTKDAKDQIDAYQFPGWMAPVNQMDSTASLAVQFGSGDGAQPFKTVQDYDNWLKRGARIPVLFDTEIANMKQGIAAGVVQPKVLMEKVVPQLDNIISDNPEKSLFWGPISKMPKDFSDADKKRLTDDYRKLIADQLMPAYKKLRAFINDEYLPKTRDTFGLDKVPNGAAWYAFNAKQSTTTDLTPDQIHQIGLDEVKRIHGEMQKVMTEVGFKGSLQDFFKYVQTDKKFEFKSQDELLKYYRGLEAKINEKVPSQFSLIPKSPFEIRPVEPFREKSAAGGQYYPPNEDGTRPGIFYVNTYDLPSRKIWDAEDLYLHEAIPGHHFQIALQIELKNLPAFRRWSIQSAFAEGWGLYAESLGKDLGVYTDPYSYFGYLQNELWRAIRLVTDTGLHSKSWSRDQVISYMKDNSAVSDTTAVAEAERYIAWPAQALAYKIGELKIKELRAKAEKELGAKFDVREFHAEVLKDGAVPLAVLEQKIDRWITSKKG